MLFGKLSTCLAQPLVSASALLGMRFTASPGAMVSVSEKPHAISKCPKMHKQGPNRVPKCKNPRQAEWEDWEIEFLKKEWSAGTSTQGIADLLNKTHGRPIRTKNAVISRAHRFGLDARPNPSKKSDKPTKPTPPPRVPTPPKKPIVVIPGPVGWEGVRTCQWTDSVRSPWVFCGEKTVPGRSYCLAHCMRAYQRRAEAVG